jgi:hypothetical protein
MGKKIKISESQLKKIVGDLISEQTATSTINAAGGTQNPNVSPLRGKTVKLYKDMNNQVQENMAMILKIRNVYQEKGLIKISVYTKINEPNMYLEHDCGKDGFNLHNSSFWRGDKTVFCESFQKVIRDTYCANDGNEPTPTADFQEMDQQNADFQETSHQSLAENTLRDTFKRLIK